MPALSHLWLAVGCVQFPMTSRARHSLYSTDYCGCTCVQDDMALDGFQEIVNIDYSPICIAHQERLSSQKAICTFVCADCCHMPEFQASHFGSVVDKGTLDAMLCGSDSYTVAAACLAEIYRVLAPGGAYILMTYGHPGSRLKHLVHADLPWSVQTFTLEKASLDGVVDARLNPSPDDSLSLQGPYSLGELLELELLNEHHFVYVCEKPL
jgi:EEF1A lysine methyltransferase 4